MKPLLVEILESILRTDEDLVYRIMADGEQIVPLTRDIFLACNQKQGDEYVGMSNLDEGQLEVYWMTTLEKVGFLNWNNYNDGLDRITNYSFTGLDNEFDMLDILNNWENKYRFL